MPSKKEFPSGQQAPQETLTPEETKTIRELMTRVGIDRATRLFIRCYLEHQWMIPKSKRQLSRDILFKRARGPTLTVVDAPYKFSVKDGKVHLNGVPLPFTEEQVALFSLAFKEGGVGHASLYQMGKRNPQTVRTIVLRMHEAIDDGANPRDPQLLKRMLRSEKGIRIVSSSTLL